MLAEPLPPGFGFSDTAFRIFILMASRRLKSDRFFTNDYTPEVYTPEGLDWVESNTMVDVLLRHHPELGAGARGLRERVRALAQARVSAALDGELPSASLLESVRFNALVIVPNAVQGVFRRRRAPVGVATRRDVDGQAVGLIGGHAAQPRAGPVWIRVLRDRALLVLDVDDVRRVLEGSPDPFAADPEAKRKGMAHFQPDALTISRGELWAERRDFTEAVLDSREAGPPSGRSLRRRGRRGDPLR